MSKTNREDISDVQARVAELEAENAALRYNLEELHKRLQILHEQISRPVVMEPVTFKVWLRVFGKQCLIKIDKVVFGKK